MKKKKRLPSASHAFSKGNPRAPSYLNSRLLGYVIIGYMEPRTHHSSNWSSRVISDLLSWLNSDARRDPQLLLPVPWSASLEAYAYTKLWHMLNAPFNSVFGDAFTIKSNCYGFGVC